MYIPRPVVQSATRKRILSSYSLSANKQKIISQFDLFLCSAGYEERTVGFLQKAKDLFSVKTSAIILYNVREANLYGLNLMHLGEIKRMLAGLKDNKILVVDSDPTNPWQFRKDLKALLDRLHISKSSKVLVDITSFTRLFLYEIVDCLVQTKCEITFVYTEPHDYSKMMAAGINDVISSPSFPGRPTQFKKSCLLLFFGWEQGRSSGALDIFDPDKVIGVIGWAPIDQKHIQWALESKEHNKSLIDRTGETRIASTLDLPEIVEFISEVYDNVHDSYDFSISCFGTKIQSLAACFFALKHEDTQIIYGEPVYWYSGQVLEPKLKAASFGIGRTYIYSSLPL